MMSLRDSDASLIPGTCSVVGCRGQGWILLVEAVGRRLCFVCEPCAWKFGECIEHVPGLAKMYVKADLFEGWRICASPTDIYGVVLRRETT